MTKATYPCAQRSTSSECRSGNQSSKKRRVGAGVCADTTLLLTIPHSRICPMAAQTKQILTQERHAHTQRSIVQHSFGFLLPQSTSSSRMLKLPFYLRRLEDQSITNQPPEQSIPSPLHLVSQCTPTAATDANPSPSRSIP